MLPPPTTPPPDVDMMDTDPSPPGGTPHDTQVVQATPPTDLTPSATQPTYLDTVQQLDFHALQS